MSSVLPESLCRHLSPELDWQWVTGFKDSGVQFIIEKALPHFRGALGEILPRMKQFFVLWCSLDLDTQRHTSQVATRGIEGGTDAIGRCFKPLPKLREIVEKEDLDKYPERALDSVFVVDGRHFRGRVYGGLEKAQSYYSHRLGTAAYQFQSVVLRTGLCTHVTDVEPAAMHDVAIYKKIDHCCLQDSKQEGLMIQ